MKKIISIFTLLTLAAGFVIAARSTSSGQAASAPVTEINWDRGFITSRATASIEVRKSGQPADSYTGLSSTLNRARMDAYQRARDAATERLVLTLKRMRIDSENLIGDIIGREKYTQQKISDALMHALKVKEAPADFYSSGCEVKMRFADIIGSLPYNFPEQDFPTRDDSVLPTDYTGLIIDGRGLDIEKMLYPSIFDEDGLEIYGRIFVESRYACRHGIASYCFNEQEAMKNPKAGRRPYYTTAIRTLNGNPVVSDRDARRILGARNTRNSLKKCNVIIILSRENRERRSAR